MENRNPLSADTLKRIEDTAAKISVAHDLDPEIQSELRSHLEEKLLAYLAGQEKLSEEDALLLTHAHFGNAATIKSLFQHAHSLACHVSLARRLIAAIIAGITISYVVRNVVGLLFYFLLSPILGPLAASGSRLSAVVWILGLTCTTAMSLFILFVLWRILVWWRRGITQGRRYWFQKWPLSVLLLLAPVVWYAAGFDLPLFRSHVFLGPTPALMVWLLPKIMLITSVLVETFTILLWLWWCDQAPYLRRTAIYTTAFWLAYNALGAIIGFAKTLYFGNPGGIHPGWPKPSLQNVLSYTQPVVLQFFLIAVVVLAAYLLYRRRRPLPPASSA